MDGKNAWRSMSERMRGIRRSKASGVVVGQILLLLSHAASALRNLDGFICGILPVFALLYHLVSTGGNSCGDPRAGLGLW